MSHGITNIYDASRARVIIHEFHETRTKIELIKEDIWFNSQCKHLGLTPNYIKLKENHSTKAAERATNTARLTWLNTEIKNLHGKKQKLIERMYKLHLEIGAKDMDNKLNYLTWKHENTLAWKIKRKHTILDKKLSQLKAKSEGTRQKRREKTKFKWLNRKVFHDRMINTTQTKFTNEEIGILEIGHKHNLSNSYNNKKVIDNIIVESEMLVQQLPIGERTHARHLITESIKECQDSEIAQGKTGNDTSNLKLIKELKHKIKRDNLIVTKADKGNCTVIMDKQAYIEKTNDFIKQNNLTQMKNDPTHKFQKQLKDTLKHINFTMNWREKYSLINMNPSAPTLKSLPKVHKENMPIRPIVNGRTGPTYKLEKFLQRFLKTNYSFKENRSIESSITFANRLKDFHTKTTDRILSLDIVNMYSNVPTGETIEIIKQNLEKNAQISDQEVNEIIVLLRLVVKQNYFTFNGAFYTQTEGLPMGSPLSGMLANIFIDKLENTFLGKQVKEKTILEWSRFVDDIFVIYDSTKTNDQIILEEVNKEHPNIVFTKEIETGNKLNHLDLTINRTRHKYEIDIYRKDTMTNHTIHESSNHPQTQKTAAFRFMINRMFSLPLSKGNRHKEINIIKQIARDNNYKEGMIDKLIRKQALKLKQERYNIATTKQEIRYAPITYVNKNTHKIGNMLNKKYGLTPAYKTKNTIKTLVHNNKIGKMDAYKKSGVYALRCNEPNCESEYIGQSGRSFNLRYKEHIQGLRGLRPTAFSEHMVENNHNFTTIHKDLKILHTESKGRKLNTLEELEIHRNIIKNSNNLNEQTGKHRNILFTIKPRNIRENGSNKSYTQHEHTNT